MMVRGPGAIQVDVRNTGADRQVIPIILEHAPVGAKAAGDQRGPHPYHAGGRVARLLVAAALCCDAAQQPSIIFQIKLTDKQGIETEQKRENIVDPPSGKWAKVDDRGKPDELPARIAPPEADMS